VDDAPWGFAPFHYGRWVYVGNRWGWLPGPVALRPVYAPALVVFVGGSNWRAGYAQGGAPVGWCPLGPRDVYVPPYRVSRGYFTHVNASNSAVIDRNHISNSYQNYAHGRPEHDREYAYRHNPAAVTAVSRETFVHARPVADSRLHLKAEQLARAEIDHDIAPSPTTASLTPAANNTRALVPREAFHRGVITHSAPPPSAAPFAARLRVIERNGGRPLANNELRQLNTHHSDESRDSARQRVPVVGSTQTPITEQRSETASEPVAPRDRSQPKNAERARDVRVAPSPDNAVPQFQETPRADRRPHEERALPSARFAPPREFQRDTRHDAIERARSREAPAQLERRNDASAPIVDDSNRRSERHSQHNQGDPAPAPVDRPQVRPAAPVRAERQPPENTVRPEHRPSPHNQQPAPQAPAPEAGRVRVEHDRNAKHDAKDESQEPSAPGR
jgi:hypothetical protein